MAQIQSTSDLHDDTTPAVDADLNALGYESTFTNAQGTADVTIVDKQESDCVRLIPLSYGQERLWFLDQLGVVGTAYKMRMGLRLVGDLQVDALERCFAEIVHRHEILRTHYGLNGGTPYQMIEAPGNFKMHRVDISHIDGVKHREEALRALISRDEEFVFNLCEGPLFRVVLAKLDQREYALLVTMHHSVSDGWSRGILHRELSALYAACVQGRSQSLPRLPIQYADYAVWQRRRLRGEVLQSHLRYWRDQLHDAPPCLKLPTDWPRPAVESFRGGEFRFELPAPLVTELKVLARRERATLFMVLLAAFQVLLSRYSGQDDIVIGTPIAGRAKRELDGVIGCFVNTLALRIDGSAHQTFREILLHARGVVLDALEHQDLPFELLVKEVRPQRDLSRQPIVQVVLALQNYPEGQLNLPGLTWTNIQFDHCTTHFDLTLYLYPCGERLSAVVEYASDLFSEQTIARMAEHFRMLLEGAIAQPDSPVQALSLLTEAEKRKILVDWCATEVPYQREKLIHELFEQQCQRTPHAIAIVHGTRSLSYADLNNRADRLARRLRMVGIGPDRLVAICIERTPEMIVGLLAILKAGGAYVPLDPKYPSERLHYMLEDAAPQVLLTQEKLRSVLPSTAAKIIDLDSECRVEEGERDTLRSEIGLTADNLVYVIYTSGSTGRPKGTAMTHRSMVNLIEWQTGTIQMCQGDRVLQFAALSFDVAFQEIFSTICAGGTLVLVDEWARRDAQALLSLLKDKSVGRLFLPPLMLQTLAESVRCNGDVPYTLKHIIAAGEQLRITPEIVEFIRQLEACRLHNHYGPTESHVIAALTLAGDPSAWPARPSIGRPIRNTQMYVLDAKLQPVPIGVAGEIYIGGANVARGYLRTPEVTAQRFIADPFSSDRAARFYRTGDWGRWKLDGTVEYLGRKDEQVKIRGYRIELGEIEAQLTSHEQVRDAVVIVREHPDGDKRLIAYVTPSSGCKPNAEELGSKLKALLPAYMVPSAYVVLDMLPVTPSGKLDRRALPEPNCNAYVREDYQPPTGELEEAVAAIWRKLLQVERIGRHDNFFDMGGHSLLATRVISQINHTLEVNLSVRVMFERPTIHGLTAMVLEEIAAELSPEGP